MPLKLEQTIVFVCGECEIAEVQILDLTGCKSDLHAVYWMAIHCHRTIPLATHEMHIVWIFDSKKE